MFPPSGFGGFGRGFSPEELRKQFNARLLTELVEYIAQFHKKKKDKDFHKGKGIPVTDGSSLKELMLQFQKEVNVNRTPSKSGS